MYNRRNFLRNGIGLAGIIAAQECPAFVKGLVAASNSIYKEHCEKDAESLVRHMNRSGIDIHVSNVV